MTRHENVLPRNPEQVTLQVAQEMKIGPDTPVWRYLHPVMVCGIENDQLLLAGNKANGTLITDEYQEKPKDMRASALPNPGLNFTTRFHDNYKNPQRRMSVSLKMKDQPKGLRIYKDGGSEASSVYFTLPAGEYFHVDVKEHDPLETAIAIKIHQLMKSVLPFEVPGLLRWGDKRHGVQVAIDFKTGEKKWDQYQVQFVPKGNDYVMQALPSELPARPGLEELAVYRFFIEDRSMNEIIGASGKHYTREALLQTILDSTEYKTLKALQR